MSIFPMIICVLSGFAVYCLFFSLYSYLLILALLGCLVFDFMMFEGVYDDDFSFPSMSVIFYFFILGEAAIFFSFFWSFIWYMEDSSASMSPSVGIPIIGCGLLFGSTILLDNYVNNELGSISILSFLLVLLCGVFFVVVSIIEFGIGYSGFSYNPLFSMSMMIVIFHLCHVCIGLFVLSWFGYNFFKTKVEDYFLLYRFKYAIYYWHFVDFIWFLVYVLVYCF